MKILITCPPMLAYLNHFESIFNLNKWSVTPAQVKQTLSEDELLKIVPEYDGWIIGDDPCTPKIVSAGKEGRLSAIVKWGVGTDNIDFEACAKFDIPVANTPSMFGREVADLATGYLIGLARESFWIDRRVRAGEWVKPSGISLAGKKVGVVGLGDIGANLARRLRALEMNVIGYDPTPVRNMLPKDLQILNWPDCIEELDFIVIACALNNLTYHLLNEKTFGKVKRGIRIVNVSRGSIIDESALERALSEGIVHSAALDVFEVEPLPISSVLRNYDKCILGAHNASNTKEAVIRASEAAIAKLADLLSKNK